MKHKRIIVLWIKKSISVLLIGAWLLAGWPQLPYINIPPTKEKVFAASPSVQTTNQGYSTTNTTPHTINLPSGITSGDLLIAIVAHKNTTSGQGASFPAGWTELPETLNDSGSSSGLAVAYRKADGTEGASISVSFGANTRMAYATYRITGAEDPSTQAPQLSGTTANNTTAPDPPTISPTGGSKDYLFLAAFASSHGRITSTLPSNYSTNVGDGSNSGTGTHVGIGSGRRALTASSEDPGTFATTGAGTEETASVTVAIHPAGAAASAYEQTAFRIRTDDTQTINESSSGWEAALNTNASLPPDTKFRIRFEVEQTGGTPSQSFELRYSRNGGAYTQVPTNAQWNIAGSTDGQKTVQAVPSTASGFTDGVATTNILTGAGTSSETFVTGNGNHDNTTAAVSFTSDPSHTELEWVVLMRKLYDSQGHNADGTTFDFRVYQAGGTALDTYTNTPRVTIENLPGHIGGTPTESPNRYFVKDGNGNLYYLGEYADTSNTPVMMKSTDGGNSWNPVDVAGEPTGNDLEGGDMDLRGDTIYISMQGPGTAETVQHWRFNVSTHATAPDDWALIDEEVDAAPAPNQQCSAISQRSPTTVIAYCGDPVSADERIYYRIRNGTWGSEQTLDSTSSIDFTGIGMIRDSSDKIHFAYTGHDGTSWKIYMKTLSTSDSLGSRQTIVDTGITSAANANRFNLTPPIAWDDNGTERVGVAYRKSDNALYFRSWNASTETFDSEQLVSDNDVENNAGGNNQVIADVVADSSTDTLHGIYAEITTFDIWHDSRPSGSWGTDTELHDAVTAHWIRSLVFSHSSGNGGGKVLGYIWDNGSGGGTGYTRYDEQSLNTAPGAPTTLYTNESDTGAAAGVANPARVGDGTPVFSAIYNDSDSGDIANKYQIIVYSENTCTTQVWDSGSSGTSMANCMQGNRCSDITFGGTELPRDGSTYYWKIKYWDDDNVAGAFSACTDTFTMVAPKEQLKHGNYFFNLMTERIFTF